jgi:queuine tRNA-ribosyltransferase
MISSLLCDGIIVSELPKGLQHPTLSLIIHSMSDPHELVVGNHRLRLPAFLPDATFGVVRSVDADDLLACGIEGVVMNTFHLMQKPGSSTIQSLGGLHRMSGWEKLIVTDSGGFQAYSLIHQNPKNGRITDHGIHFKPEGLDRKFLMTPEKTIQLQVAYGSDVVICLDDCTHVDAPFFEQRDSVRRTIAWGKRCKMEFQRLMSEKKIPLSGQPRVFAVIQGGGQPELRKECAEALLEIGFDGFGFGGWPLDGKGNLLEEILSLTRGFVPAKFPMHALGVGHPENILKAYKIGFQLFDSAMPTRDARHARVYTFTEAQGFSGIWTRYVYLNDEKHIKADRPISEHCDCPTCRKYSLGYLHHLFKTGDTLFFRLATLHNLRFMVLLVQRLRELP